MGSVGGGVGRVSGEFGEGVREGEGKDVRGVGKFERVWGGVK